MDNALTDMKQGQVAQMPFHDGDGYSWGGDIVVSFGERAISFGSSQSFSERQDILALARLIAAAPEMAKALKAARQFIMNGIEFGYIRMPQPETPDSAHDTLPMIDAVLAKIGGAA